MAGLGERVRPHPDQHSLVGLAASIDAHVGERRGRQHAAHGVEGLGPRGLTEDEVAVGRITGDGGPNVLGDLVHQDGIRIEHPVHVTHVTGSEARIQDVEITVEAIPARDAGVVRDVARALLEVTGQTTPLQDLGEHVGRLFTGEVHSAQLRHRIVAVFEEHLLVQFLGALQSDRGVDTLIAGDVEVPDELVQKEATQALGTTAVPGEQRPLDHLGQVHQREHRAVEIGEVTAKDLGLRWGELLGGVDRHGRSR
ncbi:unannotated protein [freshwater metagenome]|uniref:Unannotated protein n=1 Tax=freshwater metagenome TaxID=449393 RepID=A0A6J6FTG1_9ZZZZ